MLNTTLVELSIVTKQKDTVLNPTHKKNFIINIKKTEILKSLELNCKFSNFIKLITYTKMYMVKTYENLTYRIIYHHRSKAKILKYFLVLKVSIK